MKLTLSFLFSLFLFSGYSQADSVKTDTIQNDTIRKTIVINPLPVSIYNILKTKGTGVEVTMYKSSTTFSLPKNTGTNYFLSFIEGKSTINFNKENSGYIMILVNNDFYMEAEVSISAKSSYIVFKKDGKEYYNILTKSGIIFFKKYL